MNKKFDGTGLLNRAIDILLLENSFTTCMGILFGFIIWGFGPDVSKLYLHVNFIKINPLLWATFGAFIFNIKHLFFPKKLPQSVEEAVRAISVIQQAADLDEFEVKQKYRKLLNIYLNNVNFNSNIQEEIEEIKRQLPEAKP